MGTIIRSAESDKKRDYNVADPIVPFARGGICRPPPPCPRLRTSQNLLQDTNTSVYAEVCVPQFRDEVTPVELAVKIVVPDTFCYERVITTCEATSTFNPHTLCTSTYESVEAALKGTVTQVTYEDKSETT